MTTELKNSLKEKQKIPDIRPGDTVKIYLKIKAKPNAKKGAKNQIFAGRVIAIKHKSEPGATITVRRESKGTGADVAIEKIIPLYSPIVSKIEIVERKKVRRAKLYYLRKLKKKIHLKKGKEINKSVQKEKKEEKQNNISEKGEDNKQEIKLEASKTKEGE